MPENDTSPDGDSQPARADGGAPPDSTLDADRDPDSRAPNSRLYRWLDDRFDLSSTTLGKPFPDDRYGSFLLGEVALFSFVVLAGTGSFLGLLYAPVVTERVYDGQVLAYAGRELPGAFASVLRITYDVRLGMYTRMLHHWAAYVFVAAIAVHMFRVFFSGAYRNPREPNWVIGSGLLLLAIVEGFLGYALPYDNFSKTATSIGFTLTESIPVVGTRLTNLVFGGDFPANAQYVLPRLFFYHVFLVPAVIGGLIALHLVILIRQTHTEQEGHREEVAHGPDADDASVVMGIPLYPNQAAITTVVFCFTVGVISLLAGLFPVQPVAILGPADPFQTPASVHPDWFFMWDYGALKLVGSAFGDLGRFVGGVLLPSLLVLAMVAWPFVDRSDEPRHFAENPLDRPLPTAVGVGTIALIIMLSIAGMNTAVADYFGVDTEAVNAPLLVLTVAVPLAWGAIVYVMLKRRERRRRSGSETAADARPTD